MSITLQEALEAHKTFNTAEEAKAYLQTHILVKNEGVDTDMRRDQVQCLGHVRDEWNVDLDECYRLWLYKTTGEHYLVWSDDGNSYGVPYAFGGYVLN